MNTPDKSLVFQNHVYMFNPPSARLRVGGFIFNCHSHVLLEKGTIALNSAQRKCLALKLAAKCQAVPVDEVPGGAARWLSVDIESATSAVLRSPVDTSSLAEHLLHTFDNQHFSPQQQALIQHGSSKLLLTVREGEGMVGSVTEVCFQSDSIPLLHSNQPIQRFNFDSMGIGGLRRESDMLFRRAFASRMVPTSRIQALGVRHVKGVLLHGPPGTGKTLIARKLSQNLTGIEPKVVNGPEVLNRFVGASEENIRGLFKDAEDAQRRGVSGLHVIIFDEIDAICKQRGASASGSHVGDSVVNQLLTKMDGVDPLDNIIVIGLTNRVDLLDVALLRPGRFEVQIEISLPSAAGRRDILDIHTATMRSNGLLCDSFDPAVLVDSTKNFSGAEIEGLVKSAASHAMAREEDGVDWKVGQDDFLRALQEVRPRFGSDLSLCDPGDVEDDVAEHAHKIFAGHHAKVVVGRREVAVSLALGHGAPFTRMLRGDELAVFTTQQKIRLLVEAFEMGSKSQDSVIILDDLELIIEFCDVGPVFCNKTLQALKALLHRTPHAGHQLYILAVTKRQDVMQRLGLLPCFPTNLC